MAVHTIQRRPEMGAVGRSRAATLPRVRIMRRTGARGRLGIHEPQLIDRGGGARRHSPKPAQPEVSPDGKLVLGVRADLASRSFTAFLMNADGSNRRDIASVRGSTWFLDGSRILARKEHARDDRSIVLFGAAAQAGGCHNKLNSAFDRDC